MLALAKCRLLGPFRVRSPLFLSVSPEKGASTSLSSSSLLASIGNPCRSSSHSSLAHPVPYSLQCFQ